jgi:hypothetical protein
MISSQAFGADSFLLEKIDLKEINLKKRITVYQSAKFKLSLMNGFCDSETLRINVTKKEINKNLSFYVNELPIFIDQFEKLISELKPDFFKNNSTFYPLDVNLSIDGDVDCYNATAEGKIIEIPVRAETEAMSAVFKLLYHEIGHIISHFNGIDQNIFDETIADAMSLLLNDKNGILPYESALEIEEMQENLVLGKTNPVKLARKLEMDITEIPDYIRENSIKLKCISKEYYRDIRKDIPLVDIYNGGGESYITSCAIHSFLYKLGKVYGHEIILKRFVSSYLYRPQIFGTLEFKPLIENIFGNLNFSSFDTSFKSLSTINVQETMEVSLKHHRGHHYSISWDHLKLDDDWGILALVNNKNETYASFGINNTPIYFSLIPKNKIECKSDLQVCLCPRKDNTVIVKVGWKGNKNIELQNKILVLPPNKKECFELNLDDL